MRCRLRSTIKWSGTVLTVLLLVVWVGSAWWYAIFYLGPTLGLGVHAGRVLVVWEEPWSIIPVSSEWELGRHSSPLSFSWWFYVERGPWAAGTYAKVYIPLWALVVLFAAPTLRLWWRDRRKPPGLCVKCGYDLRGADHAVCPECGAAAPRVLKAES
ncbi:MAG: hypothetical protein IT430_09090 [Phycisphaerales bacterium]|nr:hypothetical protein [Phycisphaerales bacterium]